MPTTSPDVTTATDSTGEERRGRLDEAHRLLLNGEAIGEEAITSVVEAWTQFVRAFLPGILTEPARALDLAFELAQQAMSLQRRFVRELVGSVQLTLADAASDQPFGGRSLDGTGSNRSGQSRPPATRSAA